MQLMINDPIVCEKQGGKLERLSYAYRKTHFFYLQLHLLPYTQSPIQGIPVEGTTLKPYLVRDVIVTTMDFWH